MIIESLDALKIWLVKELEPICDADPAALAKYVIALAKKDKPEADLKALCEDQLDVFLGEETKPFVGNLFEALMNKAYLPPTPPPTVNNTIEEVNTDNEPKGTKRKSFEENPNKSEGEKLQKTENKVDVSKAKTVDDKENIDNTTDALKVKSEKNENEIVNINDNKLENNDNKNNDVNMRSMSQDRSVKSMSPGVRSGRHGHSSRRRSSRSPSNRNSRHSSRRQPSSRSSRKEPHDSRNRDSSRRYKSGRRERCRDYEEKGYCMLGETCRFDHGRDPVEVDDRNLPQMLSLAASSFPTSQPNPPHLPNPPLQVFPNVLPPRPLVPQMGTTLNTGLTTVQVQKTRPSPVELPGAQVPIFRPRNPMAFMRNLSPTGVPGAPPRPPPPPPPTVLQQIPGRPLPTTTPAPTSTVPGEPYNPEEPSIGVDGALIKVGDEKNKDDQVDGKTKETENNKKKDEDNRTQDELVQIAMGNIPLTPIVGSQPSSMFQLNGAARPQEQQQHIPIQNQHMMNFPDLLPQTYMPMPVNSQIPLHQQQQQQAAIFAAQQQQQQQQNSVVQVSSNNRYQGGRSTVLEIRKIPKELNNMVKLSEHFQKFGTITKLQTLFEQDPQGALIEFSTNREAFAAYSSPEAILSNRFIKMFWHKPQRYDGKDTNKVSPVTSTASEQQQPTTSRPPAEPKKIANAHELRYRNPKSDPKLIQMEKKKELEKLEKLKEELRRRKQESYEDLVKKQKDISLKLQGKSISKEEKGKLLKTFKACDAAVKKLEKELQEETKAKSLVPSPVKQFKNNKKEILDKEIDIYHGNLEGDELLEAKKDLELLKQEAYDSGRGRGYRGRGRGSWHRGRGRGGRGAFNSTSVDNRPKKILVVGYDDADKDAVVAHFATFGHLEQIEEVASNKMVLSFPTRKSAEVAAIQGTDFNGKQLTLSWFTGQTNKTPIGLAPQKIQRRMTRSLSQSLMDKELEDELLEDLDKDEEEMLLAGVDDDEEEDSEGGIDRSWRR